MTEVKRYGPTCDCMSEMAWGDYVQASAYDALQSRLDAAEQDLAYFPATVRQLAERDAVLREAHSLVSMSRELLSAISMHANTPPSGWCDSFKREVDDRIEKLQQFDALLSSAEPVECPECEPQGVFATDGSGPWDCYACGKEAESREGAF